MTGWRLFLLSFLLCLPALLIIGGGVYFNLTEVPQAVRREAVSVSREYREKAEELIANPERATYVGERQKGWRLANKINGVYWGYEEGVDKDGKTTRIWFRASEKEWRAITVDTVYPFPYELVFYGGGSLIALALLWLSAHAVRFMVRYVKSRDDFLAATAHDLTTPLVGMRMMIGRDDGEAKLLSERMLLIVSNIKDFLRLGGRRKPEPSEVDVIALAREAYRLFAADYEDSEGGAVAFVDAEGRPLAADAGLTARADETMTLQILWNLFGNDLKYAAPYGRVTVRFGREGEFVRIEFADEGRGLSRHQMKRAFDRYYRAQTVLESGKGGFGIGLCTAKEFAEAMGGRLSVRANSPHGCIFALVLPVFGQFNKIAESR